MLRSAAQCCAVLRTASYPAKLARPIVVRSTPAKLARPIAVRSTPAKLAGWLSCWGSSRRLSPWLVQLSIANKRNPLPRQELSDFGLHQRLQLLLTLRQ